MDTNGHKSRRSEFVFTSWLENLRSFMNCITGVVTHRSRCYEARRVLRLHAVALLTLLAQPIFGGVVLDGSFGTHGALPGPNFMITAPMGRQVGGNLFQSFSQFNLNSTQSATFSGPNNVHNILSRVTSGSPSSIDGRINSSIPGANLFFLNPAGVMFGEHAQVNVSGSFAVSTANYLKLADGGRFNANLGGGDVLTSAPVSAFGFLSSAPAPISFIGTNTIDYRGTITPGPGLNIAPQKSFSIVAGDIAMNASTIMGEGSRANLVSVKSPGEATLDATSPSSAIDITQFNALGTITMSNAALIDTSGPAGGTVAVRGGNLFLDNSQIISESRIIDRYGFAIPTSTRGGDIDIGITDGIRLTNGGLILAADGGDVKITADEVLISASRYIQHTCGVLSGSDGNDFDGLHGNIELQARNLIISGVFAEINSSGTFNLRTEQHGNINLTLDSLKITDGGRISCDASGSIGGNDGNITITAKSVVLENGTIAASASFFGPREGNIMITANSVVLDDGTIAATATLGLEQGNIAILAHDVRLVNVGQIDADQFFGDGSTPQFDPTSSNIALTAASLLIDGTKRASATNAVAGIFDVPNTDSFDLYQVRKGSITVDVQSLIITGGGKIASNGSSTFDGGNISVSADSLLISGEGSAIQAEAQPWLEEGAEWASSTANAGSVTVRANDLVLLNGGEISSSSISLGNGGNVTVTSDSLSISGAGSGIFANTKSAVFVDPLGGQEHVFTGSGNAGNVLVQTKSLTIDGGGEISSSTVGPGRGGSVSVTANSLLIDGVGSGIFATAESGSSGKAGQIIVQADDLTITTGAQISSSTSGTGNGGDVTVAADSLSIDGTTRPDLNTGIFAASNPDATGSAGNLTISVDKLLNISRGGIISAGTFSSGEGGDVTIHAGSLSIDGSATTHFRTGIFLDSDPGATGDAGNLTITVDNLLSIVGRNSVGSGIFADTYSSGNGGSINIHAGSLSIDDSGTHDTNTGIFAASYGDATGNAGNLTITVDKLLTMIGGAQISAQTFTAGEGGDVTLHTGSLSLDGSGTGITADTYSTGDAGSLTITVDGLLTIAAGSQISARTFFSSGNAGDVTVHARSLSIDGSAISPELFETGILVSSGSENPNATGNAGDLAITVDKLLSIVGGGRIAADTFSKGKGGNINIHAGSLSIDGSAAPDFFTGIEADSTDGAMGDAGNITIEVGGVLSMVGSLGGITAPTFSSGDGGDLTIHAGSLLVDGSAIFAESTASGKAGNVSIQTAGPVKLKHGGQITTRSRITDAGSIDIISGGKVKLKDRSSITVSAGRNGGDINITAPKLVYLVDSSITATAGTNLTSTGVGGKGGNITIDPQFIVLQNSFISANAAVGQGGNVKLVSDFLFNSDLSNDNITASGTTNGTVNITAPQLDLGSELITLPASLLSAGSQLQERCTALLRGDFSSFISIGRGGTEPAPEELQEEF